MGYTGAHRKGGGVPATYRGQTVIGTGGRHAAPKKPGGCGKAAAKLVLIVGSVSLNLYSFWPF